MPSQASGHSHTPAGHGACHPSILVVTIHSFNRFPCPMPCQLLNLSLFSPTTTLHAAPFTHAPPGMPQRPMPKLQHSSLPCQQQALQLLPPVQHPFPSALFYLRDSTQKRRDASYLLRAAAPPPTCSHCAQHAASRLDGPRFSHAATLQFSAWQVWMHWTRRRHAYPRTRGRAMAHAPAACTSPAAWLRSGADLP